MRAIILVGHGSLRSGSGAAMIRLAARVRNTGVAPIAAAGFLNYSRPTLVETLGRCIEQGATEAIVMPYFLIPGRFVAVDIPPAVAVAQQSYPTLPLHLTRCFDDHPALDTLVELRAAAAEPSWVDQRAALLLMAHGSPDPSANRPIYAVVQRLNDSRRYATVAVSFLDLNPLSIPDAIAQLVAQGQRRIVAVPYFLQLGGHVAEDLPQIVAAAQQQHPDAQIRLAPHLGYDAVLVDVIRDRVQEVVDAMAASD